MLLWHLIWLWSIPVLLIGFENDVWNQRFSTRVPPNGTTQIWYDMKSCCLGYIGVLQALIIPHFSVIFTSWMLPSLYPVLFILEIVIFQLFFKVDIDLKRSLPCSIFRVKHPQFSYNIRKKLVSLTLTKKF